MKKINFKNLSSDEILTRDELKKITGGNGSSDDGSGASQCTATCTCPRGYRVKDSYDGGGGTEYTATITCEDGCVAIDGTGVSCIAPSNLSLTCDAAAGEMCEKIPIQV